MSEASKTITGMPQLYLLGGVLLMLLPSLFTMYNQKLIVAGKAVNEEPFTKSVIYVYTHSEHGATGVILNKRLTPDQENLIPDELVPLKEYIYLGGPMELPSAITLLDIRLTPTGVDDIKVTPLEEAKANSPDILQTIANQDKNPTRQLRLYMGYAGWRPMQLELEFWKSHTWSSVNLYRELFFTPTNDIWKTTYNKSQKAWKTPGGST